MAVLELIKPRVETLPEMQDSFSELLQDLSALEKQVLVERHLISREHAAKGVGSAVVMNRRQTLEHHDQRRRSFADAIDALRFAIEAGVQASRQSRYRAGGRISSSLTIRGSVI